MSFIRKKDSASVKDLLDLSGLEYEVRMRDHLLVIDD